MFRNTQYLNCPRCGLPLRPRTEWLAIERCPRCLARRRAAVDLFASTLPAEQLYGARTTPADDQQTEGPA